MTQAQLDRQVAKATGESVELVRSLGFSELVMVDTNPPQPAGQQMRSIQRRREKILLQPLQRKAA